MGKRYILFDVDGTLTDPMVGITKSVQYALRRYGIEEPDLEKLTPFIGPPLVDSFMGCYGFSEKQAREAVLVYREYYTVKGILENKELPGVREMLERLKAAGKKLYVATSKPEPFAKRVLEHFRLDSYFALIGGADMEETRVRKGDVIRYVMDKAGIREEEKPETVMIGDRKHDILGAKENSLESIGVLFGYGSREELEQAGADWIAADAGEVVRILGG